MDALLTFLQGKKTAIVGILGLFVVYLVGEGLINDNLAYLLQGIITILGGGASIATKKMYAKKAEAETLAKANEK